MFCRLKVANLLRDSSSIDSQPRIGSNESFKRIGSEERFVRESDITCLMNRNSPGDTEGGRWRPLTVPGPKRRSSGGRISCSGGRARRRIGPGRRRGASPPLPETDGPECASPRALCLWPPAPPETGRRWRSSCDREQISTTPI